MSASGMFLMSYNTYATNHTNYNVTLSALKVSENTDGVYLTGSYTDDTDFGGFINNPGQRATTTGVGTRTYILKLDKNLTYDRAYWVVQSNDNHAFPQDLMLDDNDNIYTVGMFYQVSQLSFSSMNGTSSNVINNTSVSYPFKEGYMVKHDLNGNAIWLEGLYGDDEDVFTGIDFSDDNIYLTGYFTSQTVTADNLVINNDGSNMDILLIKYDLNGNAIDYKKPVSTINDRDDKATTISVNQCGEKVYFGGYFSSDKLEIDGSSVNSINGYADIFAAKTSIGLNIELDNITHVTSSGNYGAISISVSGGTTPYSYNWSKDGVYFSSQEDISNLLPGEYIVSVTDASVCMTTKTKTVVVNEIFFMLEGENENTFEPYEVTFYPNPSNSIFNISYQFEEEANAIILIYNALGKLVYQQKLDTSRDFMQISKEELGAAGVYSCVITVNGEKQKTQKLIIAK